MNVVEFGRFKDVEDVILNLGVVTDFEKLRPNEDAVASNVAVVKSCVRPVEFDSIP